ncbi:DUF952 domain-containing protein [Actinomycetospora straminea]|uniref:DUF952 domain-containing protein n=1 Tax=Actinomycetospora straminea TaxID=663607 RepID=A0ABP9ET34_9PSEU|nr:DUF952 domain-containing protein [Actinomycetospora straminea]MDD7934890.1 DUF952 domain-containing protein [Actinomycetospora straminea]
MILHLCSRGELEAARRDGARRPPSLAEVGFVHCSDPGTVHLPASRLFAGRADVVVLVVDPARLDVPVRWEPGVGPGGGEDPRGPWFPHVYGPLPLDAVVAVHDLVPEPDGTFRPPPGVASPPAPG